MPIDLTTLANASTAATGFTPASTPSTSTSLAFAGSPLATSSVVFGGTQASPANVLASQTSSAEILRYPLDPAIYYLALFIYDYTSPAVMSPATVNLITTIGLPLPITMYDSQSIELNAHQRTTIVGIAQQLYQQRAGVAANGKQPGSTAGTESGSLLGTAAAGIAAAAQQGFTSLENIAGGLGSFFEQVEGIAKNPFLTVDLNSQNFKEHSFSWKFSPRSPDESSTLNRIINTLKNHSLPAYNTTPYFLNYPSMVLPMYIPNQNQLYQFKFCLISSVTVNWASASVPAFFTGTQAPVEVSMNLKLMEVELWFQGDSGITTATAGGSA